MIIEQQLENTEKARLTKEDFKKAMEALEKANVKGPITVTTPKGTFTVY